jgi:tol-pal system protein YbgF
MLKPFFLAAMGALVLAAMALSGPAHAQGQAALSSEMRIIAMEDRMRELNGRIEELNNTISQLKQQLDRFSSDVDVRFSQIQGGGAANPPPQLAPLNGAPPPPQSKPPVGAGVDLSQPASRSGTLGTIGADGAPVLHPPQQATAPAAAPPPPSGNATDQYNYAMGLLTQANYPAAEQAMRGFVERYPKDPLAGNAQYWLGETFYVRKDWANAATAFAQGYEKYPKGQKASDDLLKLGMSLTNLDQKADACRAYARLERDFPSPPPSIKERVNSEKQRARC